MKDIEQEKYILQKKHIAFRELDKIDIKNDNNSFIDFNYLVSVYSKNIDGKEKINKIKLHQKITGRKALIKLFAKNESV